MPLDDRRLLLNGLQPSRRLSSFGHGAYTRSAKRQKTEGMNSRYDQMIRSVNVMHGLAPHSGSSRRPRHGRAVSSSSGTSYDVRKTPLDAYSSRDDGRLGNDFSVMKMEASKPSVGHADMFAPNAFHELDEASSPTTQQLPSWLRGTLSALDSKHSLRVLVPGKTGVYDDSSPSGLAPSSDPPPQEAEESPFAFTVSDGCLRKLSPPSITVVDDDILPARGYSHDSFNIHDVEAEAEASRPFSTPGPASSISVDSVPSFPRSLVFDADLSNISTTLPYRNSPPNLVLAHSPFDLASPPAFVPFSKPGPAVPIEPGSTSAVNLPANVVSHSRLIGPSRKHSPALCSPTYLVEKSWPLRDMSPVQSLRTAAHHFAVSPPIFPARSTIAQHTSLDFKPFTTPGPSRHHHPPSDAVRVPLVFGSPLGGPSTVEFYSSDLRELNTSYSSPTLPPATLGPQFGGPGALPDVVGFQWEKYDRNGPALRLSSSPKHVAEGSDEAFWSQPAQMEHSSAAPPNPQGAPLASMLQSHPAAMCSPASPRNNGQGGSTYSYRDRLTPTSRDLSRLEHKQRGVEEDEGGPFIWIVPPRDQPPPSTPRRPTRRTGVERQPTATPRSNHAEQTLGRPTTNPETNTNAFDHVRIATPARPCGSPFAPAPEIYVSPLRGEADSPNKSTNLTPRTDDQNVKPKPNPPMESLGSAPVTPRRSVTPGLSMVKGDAKGYEDTIQGAISQSPPKTPSVHRNRDRPPEDEIEEVDELVGWSQETRDTIESWTD
ncbi:hypothetical protein C8Q79DRAFT_1119252 [Trametes meyenii]|nr:hypothetical protein C8Q79DRAFT_1119252 [Trametes meyenii]